MLGLHPKAGTKATHWITNASATARAKTGKPPTVEPPWLPATATRAAMTTTTGRATSALRSAFFMVTASKLPLGTSCRSRARRSPLP